MINILEESDGILIGTPTINADAPKPVWDLLSCMMYLEKRGKTGQAFGSYGWSGEAVNMILDRMKSLHFRVPPIEPMKIRLIPNEAELKIVSGFRGFEDRVKYLEARIRDLNNKIFPLVNM